MSLTSHTRPASKTPPMLSGGATAITLGILLLLALSFFGIPPFDTLRSGFTELTYCVAHDCDPSGPAASWEEQLAAASGAATKIDSRAFLISVSAGAAAHNEEDWSPEKALRVRFSFYTPDGKSIEVSLVDTSPATALEVNRSNHIGLSPFYSGSRYTPETLSETMRTITISPRQVVSITWPLASVQANQRLQKVHPLISFDPLTYEYGLSKPDVWYVSYWTSQKGTPLTSAFSSGFAIDKSTGELLGHKYNFSDPLFPTPTPK